MSKRFGRNQRRRARDRIKELECAITMDRELLRYTTEKKARLEREIEDAKRIVGRMSVLFEPEPRRLDGPARSPMHLFTQSAVMNEPRAFFHAKSETVPLPVMLSRVHRDIFSRAIHCKVTFDDGQWGYAISQDAVLAMPEDVLIQRVTQHLAMTIGRNLAELKPERGERI